MHPGPAHPAYTVSTRCNLTHHPLRVCQRVVWRQRVLAEQVEAVQLPVQGGGHHHSRQADVAVDLGKGRGTRKRAR